MYISNNSYRVLGVVSNASLKDVQKNISKLKAFAKIGKQMDLDYDFSCLNLSKLNRIDDLLLKSESQIKLDKNRIQNSLFWFVDINPIDSVALSHLIKGDVVKSIEIWDKVIKSNEVNSKNFSAYSNLSTLLLFSSLDESKTDSFKKDSESSNKIKRAFKLKQELISSTYYNEYCESISKSIPITSDDAQEFFTTTVIDVLNKNYSAKELSKLFEGLDNQLVNSLTESLTDKPISSIKNHIDTASILLKKDEKSGIKSGKQLIKDSLADFKQLKEVLSPDDFKFQTISDALANQILQCGILYFNATGDDQAYLSSYKYALQVAIGDKTKNRANESIKHCEEEKEAATQNQLVRLINEFDEKYNNWEEEQRNAHFSFRGSAKGPPGANRIGAPKLKANPEKLLPHVIYLLKEFQTPFEKLLQEQGDKSELVINVWSNFIYRVINVVEMVLDEGFRYKTKARVDEGLILFSGLSNIMNDSFIFNSIQLNSEANTSYIEVNLNLSMQLSYIMSAVSEFDKEIIPKQQIPTSQTRTNSSNNSEGCYIATMVYGSYHHPNVLVLRRFRDEILKKSQFGRGFIKFYYFTSPKLVVYLKSMTKTNIMIKNGLDYFVNYILR